MHVFECLSFSLPSVPRLYKHWNNTLKWIGLPSSYFGKMPSFGELSPDLKNIASDIIPLNMDKLLPFKQQQNNMSKIKQRAYLTEIQYHDNWQIYDDVTKKKHFLRYWSFVGGIHRWIPPSQRPVTRIFGVSFDLCPNKRLSKQSRSWWFETPSCSLWRRVSVGHQHTDCSICSGTEFQTTNCFQFYIL